jgi:hypothetical protein
MPSPSTATCWTAIIMGRKRSGPKTRAINHVKFTEGLRGYEGLDFFARAKDTLSIGYFARPTFFYTQRNDSMSKTNLDDREKIKNNILNSMGVHQ